MLSYWIISLAGHILAFIWRDRSLRTNRTKDIVEHSLVLSSEVAVHDAINDGVDGAAEKPQASGKDENLDRREIFNTVDITFFLRNFIRNILWKSLGPSW